MCREDNSREDRVSYQGYPVLFFGADMDLSVTLHGLDAWVSKIRNLPKQLRYATAVSLTRSAEHAQESILSRTRDVFTIRKNWLTPGYKFGINRKMARVDDLSAEVFTRAPWMLRHEEGGTETPQGRAPGCPARRR